MEDIKKDVNSEILKLSNFKAEDIIKDIKKIKKDQINYKDTNNQPQSLLNDIKGFVVIYEGLIKSLAGIQDNYIKAKVDFSNQIDEIKKNLDNYKNLNETVNIKMNYPNKDIQLSDEAQRKFKKLYDKWIKEYGSSNMVIINKFKYLLDLFKNFYTNVNKLGESIDKNISDFESVGGSLKKTDDDTKARKGFDKILKTYTKSSEDFRKFDVFFQKIKKEEEKWQKEEPFNKLRKKTDEINTEVEKFKNTFQQLENYFPKINININELEQIFNFLKEKIKIFQNYKIKEIPIGNYGKMRIDILIILDTTNSMGKYLKTIRNELKNIKRKIEENCPLAVIYMGFIGYKDFSDLELGDEYTDIDFTVNIDDLYEQIKDLEADGGGDIPEDLAGGFELALKKDWGSGQKLAILVTDAPCHGTDFHDLDQNKKDYKDNYPKGFYKAEEGEEVYEDFKRRDINELVKELAKRDISLVCLDILKYTEKMFNIFKDIYEKEKKSKIFSIEKGNLNEIIIEKATELCKNEKEGILNILRKAYKDNDKNKKK